MRYQNFSYAFPTDAFYGLRQAVLQVKKRVRGTDGIPSNVTLMAVAATFHVGLLRVDLASIMRDYYTDRRQQSKLAEADRARACAEIDLGAPIGKDLL